MLVLTRKSGERILVGNDIVVEVRGIAENKVRIGVEAPQSTKILREELAEKTVETKGAK